MKHLKWLSALTIVLLVAACGSIKNDDDPQKAVRDFLTAFQASLGNPADSVFNEYFHTSQPRENVLAALRVLQNRDSAGVKCRADFSLATITIFEQNITVKFPVSFAGNLSDDAVVGTETFIEFWLQRTEEHYRIVQFEAENFYQTYTGVKNSKVWAKQFAEELKKREPIYALADTLETKFDSLIWYAEYNGSPVFYAVSGSWVNYFHESAAGRLKEDDQLEYSMGLINAKGDTLIPFEYELIGTIGFNNKGLVEVKQSGYYGYFDLASAKLVVPAEYDLIIPYTDDANAWALAFKDTTAGWIDGQYQFHEGYPSQTAQKYAEDFEYLSGGIVLKAGNQTLCEIPAREFIGYGIVIPPAYLSMANVFNEIVGGINSTKVPMNGWTDYVGSKDSFLARIGEGIAALVSVLEERYIGGRESFYGRSQVTFVNAKSEEIGTTELSTDKEVSFKHVGSGLLEVKGVAANFDWTPGGERYKDEYKYFQIEDKSTLTELSANRTFAFTKFVKIDSSYLMGSFEVFDQERYDLAHQPVVPEEEEVVEEPQEGETTEESDGSEESEPSEDLSDNYEGYEGYEDTEQYWNTIDMLTLATLQFMRDEILAANGYDIALGGGYQYDRRYQTVDETLIHMPEIERANYEFLGRVIDAVMEAEGQGEEEEDAI